MTPLTKDDILSDPPSTAYVLASHGSMLWRPNSCGYTHDIAQAGTYDRKRALDHVANTDPSRTERVFRLNEYAPELRKRAAAIAALLAKCTGEVAP